MSSNSCSANPLWPKLAGALYCLVLALPLRALAAGPDRPLWRQDLPGATALGHGEMRWFGLRIYDAALWTTQLPFDPGARFALQLIYHRSISRESLVQTSLEEMRRLGTLPRDNALLRQWETQLRNVLTDVAPDDQLIGVHIPGYGMRLYDQRKVVGDIPDPALAQAFFGIWLSEATRDRRLREQLLGSRQ